MSGKALAAHMRVHRADHAQYRSLQLMRRLQKQLADFLGEPAIRPGVTVDEDVLAGLKVARSLLDQELDRRMT